MASHNELGRSGEELAAAWLAARGYDILHRNWRHFQYEIDIIARKKQKLHFIEVKTRKSSRYGYPEESVTKKKFRYLKLAADEYLHLHPGNRWIQYDILSIVWITGKEPAYFLLEDVFL